MAYGYSPNKVGLALIVDVVPEYVRRTFGLFPLTGGDIHPSRVTLPSGSNLVLFTFGDDIPAANKFVILHNVGEWHMKAAMDLANQILSVVPDSQCMTLGIYQASSDTVSSGTGTLVP